MNEVKNFENVQFGNVRTFEENGKVLFCGADVAKALGYARPSEAVAKHAKGTLKRRILTNGGEQEMSFIPEGDVYRLIAHSKLPQAQEFETWIFDDVLPSIRKYGMYAKDDLLRDPELAIAVFTELKKEREQRQLLEAVNAELTPKAEYYDTVSASEGSLNFRETAKEKKFIAAIERHKLCCRNSDKKLIPYVQRIESGWFEVKEVPYLTANGTRTTPQTMITPLGREKIFAILNAEK